MSALQGERKIMANTIRSIALLGAAALALAMTACQKQGGAATSNPDAVKTAIKADEKAWNAQFKSRDSESLIGHYADDAFFVAPGVKADGSTQIRKAYTDGLTDHNFMVSFASDKIDAAGSGDMAYARGHFSETYTDPKTSKVMTGSGSYITVYKKQDDGSWKAVEDFSAADPDSVKPVPPAKPAVRAKMVSF
jgi:uncharacterized protein (TIGR02246 family)